MEHKTFQRELHWFSQVLQKAQHDILAAQFHIAINGLGAVSQRADRVVNDLKKVVKEVTKLMKQEEKEHYHG